MIQRRIHHMKNIVLLLSIALVGCGHMTIPVDSAKYQGQTGILVTASHLKEQTFLYLNDGLQVSFNGAEPRTVPWGESVFLDLEPGSQELSAWFNYTGKSGKATDCVNLAEGEVFLLEYKTPFTMFQSGEMAWKNLTSDIPVPKC
jgi:hypothetical protein